MSDIRRSILWVIFGFSMVLIWDKWQLYNGKPATFFPQPAPVATAPAADAPAAAGAAGVPTATALPGSAASQLPAASAPAAPRATHTATTDVLKLTFDTEGGSLIGADILKHKAATLVSKNQDIKPLTLLTSDANHVYVAQTGLIAGAQSVGALPTHKTPMTLVAADTELKDGQNTLTVRFESADTGGVKLVKTYTARKGGYDLSVKHEVVNTGTTPVSPQLYLQLVRDGSTTASETPFYSTFTGPAVYTNEKKYQKIEFPNIDKNNTDFIKTAKDGYVAMVQHYFASAWLLGEGIEREHFARKIDNNLYAAGMITPVGTVEPGATKAVESRLFVGPHSIRVELLHPGDRCPEADDLKDRRRSRLEPVRQAGIDHCLQLGVRQALADVRRQHGPIGRSRRRDRGHGSGLHQLGRMRQSAGNLDRLQAVFFVDRI